MRNFARSMSVLFILIGAVLVLWGADRLTDGATALAQRLGVPQIVIGLTVVAMGTSMPEFFVSLMSAIKGTSDIAVGNVLGSNTFNTLAIVGITAMVAPMTISKNTVRKDMPFSVVASLALLLMCIDGEVSRWDAAILFVGFMVFLGYTLYLARKGVAQNVEVVKLENMSYWKACGLMLLGLACLVLGSHLFVDGATEVARSLGIPDAVIGLTIVALGTSLPELATSVVAARKGQSAIAIGNVIGSNVFNILMILGITGLVLPMDIHSITSVDFAVLLGSITLLWLFCYTKYTVEKWEGGVLTLAYVVYVGWLVYRVL
ncbi:MAG: calcium/sodium antiporter [Prevotella sp.]|nr:calcium/sodium antiporter [Prevotella sp.]